MRTVVVSVDRMPGGAVWVDDDAVDQLAATLRSLAERHALGEYDGRDTFSGTSRLYFCSREADRLAGAVTQVVAPLPWRDRVRVRISLDAVGCEWRMHGE
jgi:hypothetical protein